MVTKLSSIVVNSYRASLDNAYYTFDLKTEHIVPENGKLRFNLPDTSALNASRLKNACTRLDFSGGNIALDCIGNESDNYFDVDIRSNTFGTGGLPAGEQFKV